MRTVGDNSIDLTTGQPKARIDKNGQVSYMGPDLWNFYNYVCRMDRLRADHDARFTGFGADLPSDHNAGNSTFIPVEEVIRLQEIEQKYHQLLQKYEEVTGTAYTTENPNNVKNTPTDDKFNPIMDMRQCRGTETTLKACFNTVHRFEHARARGKQHMVGFTLVESELSVKAGGMKRNFRWMWETGNFLLTAEGTVYHFL